MEFQNIKTTRRLKSILIVGKNIQKILYNNRSYIWDGNQEDLSMFRLEGQDTEPINLTKYYKLNENSVESLLKNYIYASHPLELNDPFDCYSKLIDTSEITEKEIDFVEKRISINVDRNYILNENHRDEFIDIFKDLLFESSGIISMSDSKNENPSLWANYADTHKGFAIRYDKASLKKVAIGPFQVDYIENLEPLKYESKYFNSLVLWFTNIKSKYWCNEKEWRFIGIGSEEMYVPFKHYGKEKETKKQIRKLQLPNNTIREITLGYYFFNKENIIENNHNVIVFDLNKETDKELKVKLLKHVQDLNIPLSIAVLNKKNFKFNSIKIEYNFDCDTNYFKWILPSH